VCKSANLPEPIVGIPTGDSWSASIGTEQLVSCFTREGYLMTGHPPSEGRRTVGSGCDASLVQYFRSLLATLVIKTHFSPQVAINSFTK